MRVEHLHTRTRTRPIPTQTRTHAPQILSQCCEVSNVPLGPRLFVDLFPLQLDAASVALFVEKFFTFFLLNASFVPIGLYVTMKLARSFQKVFLEADRCVC